MTTHRKDGVHAQCEGSADGVKVLAMLIDPETMAVTWTSGSPDELLGQGATRAGGPAGSDAAPTTAVPGPRLEQALPPACALDVAAAVRGVGRTGAPRHLHADVITTARGVRTLTVSLHRLPDCGVLLLAENSWHARQRPAARERGRRGGR